MSAKSLKTFLDENHVRYVTIQHSKAYTAQDVAAKTHISGKEIAKTVIVKLGGKMAMAVVPASRKV
ncbi:MAG: YbaK/EbsC family protein, partial [bacterium]